MPSPCCCTRGLSCTRRWLGAEPGRAGTPGSKYRALANVVAYVPLGWLCGVTATWAVRRPAARFALLLGSALAVSGLSLGLELTQSCQSARVSSATDWAANTAGGVLGVLVAVLLPALAHALEPARVLNRAEVAGGEVRLRLATIAVVVLWVLSECMPWVFAVDLGTPRKHLSFLLHWAPLDAWSLLRHGGAWTAVAAACRLVCGSRLMAGLSLLAAAAASLLLQLILDASAPLSYEELLAMGAVLVVVVSLLAFVSPPTMSAWWPRWLAAGLVAVVAAYELRPGSGPTSAFSWMPMVGFGNRRGALDFAWLFAWAGCGTMVATRWAQHHRDRLYPRLWPLAMIGLVLAMEVLQTRIPGRGPDTSALVFIGVAMLGTGVLLREGN